jgi:hypothetical protein
MKTKRRVVYGAGAAKRRKDGHYHHNCHFRFTICLNNPDRSVIYVILHLGGVLSAGHVVFAYVIVCCCLLKLWSLKMYYLVYKRTASVV